MSDFFLSPEFPDEIGEDAAVIFNKDGYEYRLMRYDAETWLIHKRGADRKGFELVITPDGKSHINVEGKGHMGVIGAIGVTKGILFSKLF